MKLDFGVPSGLPASLPVLPLRRGVLLPGGVTPFAVGRSKSKKALEGAKAKHGGLVLVAVQRESVDDPALPDLLPIAVLARVLEIRGGGRGETIGTVVQGLARMELAALESATPYIEARYNTISQAWPDTPEAKAMLEAVTARIDQAVQKLGVDENLAASLKDIAEVPLLVDIVAALMEADEDWKRDVLMTLDPVARAEKVLKQYVQISEVVEARRSLEERVRSETESMQREALLRRQLKAIQDELGEGGEDEDEMGRTAKRLAEMELPEEARNAVNRELKRIKRLQGQSMEKQVAHDWLEWIADLPWGKHSAIELDLKKLEETLNSTHYGLDTVKKQVVEHLAVKKLGGKGRADVLLLVGPPGVGKTSIGEAIASATQRKLVRVALGGVRDEAELRGHRRTYVGSRPGRLIEGLRRAGTADPVVLLDEVDKMGHDWRGDPAAALLEILDPEQNHSFIDHYLEVPFDLSKVLFIATANDLSQVPAPLQDRMETIEIEGYTERDKLQIARRHLFPTLAKNAGIAESDVEISEAALREAIIGWTREAGVRQLQRVLGKVFRNAAVKKAQGELSQKLVVDVDELRTYLGRKKFHDELHELLKSPGIATGLAWTPMGGDVLYVEASTKPGKGGLTLTGQLGEVMKESAQAALTYVLSHSKDLGVDEHALDNRDVHIHVPAGGVPKDGPSAGVTMFTALASLLSDRPVASDVAMTGEATLRGRVLPVGGIKSKVLAAHRKGLKRVILPRLNEPDLDELPKDTREQMEFILVDEMSEVLDKALEPTPAVIGGRPDSSRTEVTNLPELEDLIPLRPISSATA